MERLLITGVDQVAGGNLALMLADRFEVVGLYAGARMELSGCRTWPCDLANPADLTAAVRYESPQWIIHCGPLAGSSWDECDAARVAAEPKSVAALAEAAGDASGRLTVVSTDAVFAGPRMFHEEDAPSSGAGPLALAAAEVENVLQHTAALVVRSHLFGFSPSAATCFAESMWGALVDGQTVSADSLPHATPILASDLAHRLVRARQRELRGVCHIAGAERTSPARFALEMAAVLGVKAAITPPPRPAEEGPRTAVAETSLGTRRARRELGGALPMLREGLTRFVEQAADGYRERLRGAAGVGLQGVAA